MPGPYQRLDVPNVNQHVVTTPPAKVKKATKKASTETAETPAETAKS